jgi:polyisoprenoid-binding protein YceI
MLFTTVKGRFRDVQGTIRGFQGGDESETSRVSVEAQIDAASIDTGDQDRDEHLRGPDFLDVERFPTIEFKSRRVERRSADTFRVSGTLTIRDITREVVLETTYNGRGTNPWGQVVAGFTAGTTINRKDFELTWNLALESGGWLVGDKVTIMIEAQVVKQS